MAAVLAAVVAVAVVDAAAAAAAAMAALQPRAMHSRPAVRAAVAPSPAATVASRQRRGLQAPPPSAEFRRPVQPLRLNRRRSPSATYPPPSRGRRVRPGDTPGSAARIDIGPRMVRGGAMFGTAFHKFVSIDPTNAKCTVIKEIGSTEYYPNSLSFVPMGTLEHRTLFAVGAALFVLGRDANAVLP